MIKEKKVIYGFMVLFIALNTPLAEAQHRDTIITSEDLSGMENQIEKLRLSLNIPGISAGITTSDSVLWVKGFGYSDLETEIPSTPETIYPLASISKPVSALMLLIMQDKGLVDIDEPVYPYIRDFLRENSIPLDHYTLSNVTTRHLLSHTSDYPPGTGFRYDGDRYSALSQVVSAVTSISWEDNLTRFILAPAGMASTITFNQDPAEKKPLIAKPYYNEGDIVTAGSFLMQVNASVGLESSVADMLKFLQSSLKRDLASAAAYDELYSPSLLRTNTRVNYGLGWFIEECRGQKVIWHNGYGLAASGLIILLPEKDLAFVLLGNSNRISSPFPIGIPGVNIEESPFARVFLNMVVRQPSMEISPDQEIKDQWRIAHINGNSKVAAEAIQRHISAQNEEGLVSGKYLLLTELNVQSKDHHTKEFNLPADTVIRLIAQADGGYCDFFGMYDNVWLENITDGREVWRMEVSNTTGAGGNPRNRRYDGAFFLSKGRYRMHFDNSSSPYTHFPDKWEAFPPDHYFWGIKIFTKN